MRAGAIRHAQAGAEIVRVGDAVEDQQEGRNGQGVEHVVDVDDAVAGIDHGGDALVAGVAGHGIEPLAVQRDDPEAFVGGLGQRFLHAAVFTAAGDVDFDQAFGRLEQAGIDGMKTVDEFFLRHAGVRQEEAKAAFYRLVAGLAQVSVTGGASLSNVRQNAGRASAASGGL